MVEDDLNDPSPDEPPLTMVVASPIYRGPGPLPKYLTGRDPTTASLKGDNEYKLSLQKVVLPAKGSGDDAAVGSMITSVLPSYRSWSRCTDMETFA